VAAVIDYATATSGCREQKLLHYFGEMVPDDCGRCDLCVDRRARSNHSASDVQQGILYMAELRPRQLQEFIDTLSFPRDEVCNMVSFLVDEGFLMHLPDDTYSKP